MKDYKILIVLIVILTLAISIENTKSRLDTGDIIFTSFNSRGDDSFSIILLKDLPANTTILFTDDEWNGNRFSAFENNLAWNSGTNDLPEFTEIKFENIKVNPCSNYGIAIGNLKLSQDGDAIFAYIGDGFKQPSIFLSAISSDSNQYGTLLNTNLEEGKNAITLPKNTYSATLKEKIKLSKEEIIQQVNDHNNYDIKYKNAYFVSKSY